MKLIRQLVWLGLGMALGACGESATEGNVMAGPGQTAGAEASMDADGEFTEILPGLTMRRIRQGSGATAEVGQFAYVHYTGWLFDETAEMNRGRKFDSSIDRGEHFKFLLGTGRVIRGWDEGVVGMRIGEIRELTIAPALAYGDRQVGDLIPPGSTLIFEVELADLRSPDDGIATP